MVHHNSEFFSVLYAVRHIWNDANVGSRHPAALAGDIPQLLNFKPIHRESRFAFEHVRIGRQPFEGIDNSVGKFGETSIAFGMLSAHPARVHIGTGSSDSNLKNYLSAVSTKLECKSESLEFCIWLEGADCKRFGFTFGMV